MDLTYRSAGVDTRKQDDVMETVFGLLRRTWSDREHVQLDFGHFANVISIGSLGVAMSTDGIGTKAIIAQLIGKYDTVGIDCVAINVNDVLCVGAEPLSLVDYLAVQTIRPEMVSDIAKGLSAGGMLAKISIAGGESAQLPELIKGEEEGGGFDLAGTCIGAVELASIITGKSIEPGDVILGIPSSGVHCNGLTLARKALGITDDKSLKERRAALSIYEPELGETIGEALLTPTRVYTEEVLCLIRNNIDVRGIAHITQDGFLNLPRLESGVGYVIDTPPEPQPIFRMIQKAGGITDQEMYEVFNMGTGLCVVVSAPQADEALSLFKGISDSVSVIGHTTPDSNRSVDIPHLSMSGIRGSGFQKAH